MESNRVRSAPGIDSADSDDREMGAVSDIVRIAEDLIGAPKYTDYILNQAALLDVMEATC